MRNVVTALLAGLIVGSLGTAALAQNAPGPQLPTRRTLAQANLERVWWNQATMDPSRDRLKHLVADESVVVALSRSGLLTTFDAETGKKLWALRIGRGRGMPFAPVLNDSVVLAVTGSVMHAIDKYKGEYKWKFTLPAAPSTGPEIDDHRVYVGTRSGSVIAFDLKKIRRFYAEGLLPKWSYQTMAWRYKAFKEVTTVPISTGRVVFFASRGKSLYSVSTNVEQGKERKLRFQFETDAAISAPLGIWFDRSTLKRGEERKPVNLLKPDEFDYIPSILLPSEDFKLYCINGLSGHTRWVFNTGLAIRTQPYVIDNHVYVLPSGGGMYRVDVASGTRTYPWVAPVQDVVGFVAASQKRLFVSDKINNLMIVDRKTAAVTGRLHFQSFSVRFANDRTDRIIIARPSGLIAVLREKGDGYKHPHYFKYPERQPILPLLAKETPAAPKAKIPAKP